MPDDKSPAQSKPACQGVLIVYAPGEGRCDFGHDCAVYDLRWTDHDAYLAAHLLRASPGEQLHSR